MINHHEALIYTMVLVSAADSDMTNAEIRTIGEIVAFLPVFNDFDTDNIAATSEACAVLLDDEDGIDRALSLIKDALPEKLRETAYAIACDVAATDGIVTQEELRLLELIRHRLDINRLTAAAIERGARARFATP